MDKDYIEQFYDEEYFKLLESFKTYYKILNGLDRTLKINLSEDQKAQIINELM